MQTFRLMMLILVVLTALLLRQVLYREFLNSIDNPSEPVSILAHINRVLSPPDE
ncbi:TPA: hypothetical protein RG728_002241 [Morganella morganii subsp. morganii]|uniref:hypothetical protein n=1 Tax=Morganella morganii TaxID=582 RepID=UPI00131F162B|nr:hypothetical protein [Morganella morganii]EKW8485057.1 hypothetical protein [Morganella morganii]ELJ5774202.1 hypothetical protein [Morganella morganii]MBT0335962.1 hypothetical protein [Morganella morganii subsp. morganii]HAT3625719.1 hypothetical protein [Morganella morganii]HDU8693127.1 hypothetical protein [Morganella morganii subsp. morganii]